MEQAWRVSRCELKTDVVNRRKMKFEQGYLVIVLINIFWHIHFEGNISVRHKIIVKHNGDYFKPLFLENYISV